MRRRAALLAAAIALLCPVAAPAGEAAAGEEIRRAVATLAPEIRAEDLKTDAFFLASEQNEGRLTGTPGAERAAGYIAAAFERAGLEPFGKDGGWFQPFEFTSGVRQVEGRIGMSLLAGGGGTEPLPLDEAFRPLTYSGNGTAEGQVVFAGYGLVEPSGEGRPYDSYLGLDVEGKIVLVLRDIPEEVSAERRQELALYAGDRYKAKLAADRGASGFLLVVGPNSANGGKLIGFNEGSRTESVTIPAASVSGELADRLLEPAGKKLKELQDSLDSGQVNPHAGAIEGARVRLEVELERVRGECRNVVGRIPPRGGSDEYVVVGAHYDHIGHGESLGSLAREEERGGIHYGADDNASGTSTVVELAAAVAQSEADGAGPRRGVIFAAWSGEELGLVGSSKFVEDPPVPLAKIAAYFNFDMVGRLRDNKLILQSVGSSPVWRGLIERRNIPAGFNLSLTDDPYLPTDATSFYTNGIPALAFFTDLHEEYNRPADKAETLNYEGMARIAKMARMLIRDAADPALEIDYAKVEAKLKAPPGQRMGRRAYTGTVPDFAGSDVDGVKLSDVRGGGPAAEAGLLAGDIIVGFAGKEVHNLQDYSDVLTGAKIGETVEIVVMRDGKRLTFKITPTARPQE